MYDLMKLTSMVRRILQERPETRSSDCLLQAIILQEMGVDINASFKHLLLSGQLTSMESITRTRRKVQQEFPELKGATVAARRAAQRVMFENYAKANRLDLEEVE